MLLAPFQLSLDPGPDHIKAVLVLCLHSVQSFGRPLWKGNQKPLSPEFLASHEPEYKSYIRY